MNKRILMIGAIITILAVTLLLPACNGEQEPAPAPVPTSEPAPTSAPAPTAEPAPTSTPTPTPTTPPAPAEPVTFKVSYSFPKGKANGAIIEWFAVEFPKRTDGRYKVETYPANTLVPPTAVLDMVKGGSCEMATTSLAAFSRDFPLSQVSSLPMLGFPVKMQDTVEENEAVNEIMMDLIKHPAIANEYKDFAVPYIWYNTPSNLMSVKKEIHYPEDLKGFRLGGAGPSAELVGAYGGSSMMMIPPTAYDMFDKGVADGGVMNVVMVSDWKLYEVLNYYYMLDIGCGGFVALANPEFFNGLPAADQQIFLDTMYDGTMANVQQGVDNWAAAFKTMEEVGATLTWPTEDELFEWKLASEQKVVPLWRQKCIDAGVDSVTVSDTYQYWLKLRQEYLDKYNLK